MKYLHGYLINDEVVGLELSTWTDEELDGNLPFKFTDNEIEDGYRNVTSIENLDWCWNVQLIQCDYIYLKDKIRDISDDKGGWNNLTVSEKYIIIKYYIYRELNTEKVVFLMSQGMSQSQAMQYLVINWFKHNQYGFIDCISIRWKFTKFYLLTMCTKDSVEIELEREDIAHSLHLMKEYGFVGSEYGDVNTKGIMDYFNSTGFYLNQGFEESLIQCYPGITKQMVIDKIIDVMINGNYDTTICKL